MFLKKVISVCFFLTSCGLQAEPENNLVTANYELAKPPFFDYEQYHVKTRRRIAAGSSAVAYHTSGGRFGDALVAYLHAKWISYKYNIPLLRPPFEYDSQLVFGEAELMATIGNSEGLKFNQVGDVITRELWTDTIYIDPRAGFLYLVPWFPESLQEYERLEDGRAFFYVNWDDEQFLAEIRALVQPRYALNLLKLPEDKVTVAAHVRRNSNGVDLSLSFQQGPSIDPGKQYLDDYYPFKSLDDAFYIASIKQISELYPDKQLYVYIFTDDKEPAKIAQKYQDILQNPRITFDYRHEVHDHTKHVLEDFFSMLKFDCMIRSDSNFSLVISKLGFYKYIISPGGYQLKNGHPLIVRANISVNLR